MSQQKYVKPITQSTFTPVQPRTLQRKCACGGTPGPDGECAECRQKRLALQRFATNQTEPAAVPPIVREVLHSPGQPLDPTTRTFMEARLGHDFGQVRVHNDAQAGESARVVNALAYTVGRNIVFGPRQYTPGTTAGRQLLAHELAHVVHQGQPEDRTGPGGSNIRLGPANSLQEREAEIASQQVASGVTPAHLGTSSLRPIQPTTLQRQLSSDYQLNLAIDERGRVEVTLSGPNLPVISNPTIGIRRNVDGTYDMMAGGRGKTVAASEVPAMLRGALGTAGKPSAPNARQVFRMPTCSGLRSPSGTRFMTYDEYRVSQMLSPDMLPMSAALYEARLQSCKQEPVELPKPLPQLQDAPLQTLPEGIAIA